MSASAIFLGLLGALSQFLPSEILSGLNTNVTLINKLVVQIVGAVYLGFAKLNWMGKNNLIGGVYSRPVSMGNFVHFLIGAITLVKLSFTGFGGLSIIISSIL